MTTEKLLQLKKEIEKSKEELSELKGKRKVLLERLKNEFDCSWNDITSKKAELKKEAFKLEGEKEELISELETNFEF